LRAVATLVHLSLFSNPDSLREAGGADLIDSKVRRGIRAIMSIDMVGYTRAMHEDEHATFLTVANALAEVIEPAIQNSGGTVLKRLGDGLLCDFDSAIEAVECALNAQTRMAEREAPPEPARPIKFRIGIAVADVIREQGEVFGDGVNLAKRLEAQARPGSILVTKLVADYVGDRLPCRFVSRGRMRFKGFDERLKVFDVVPAAERAPLPLRRYAVPALAAVLLVIALAAGYVAYRAGVTDLTPFASVEGPKEHDPVIAVLPFDNMTGNDRYDPIADGLSEDLITHLARFRALGVISRQSSFAFRGRQETSQAVALQLNARYLVEGSLQRRPDGLRVTVQLIDGRSAHHVWADYYDVTEETLLDVQDELIRHISASALTSDIGSLNIAERARARSTKNLTAYGYLMQGWNHWYKETREDNRIARELFEKSAEIDPAFARAYAGIAWTYANEYDWNWTDDHEHAREQAYAYAQKALDLDPYDYKSYWALGWAQLYNWEHDAAIKSYERALQLNPNDAELLAEMSNLLIYIGNPDQAIEQLVLAMRLNPYHPQWYEEYLGWGYEEAGRPEDAIRTLEPIREPEEWVRRTLAAAYAAVGRQDDARQQIEAIVESDPSFSLAEHEAFVRENYPYRTEAQIERWIEAFRLAGPPP
jgi:adenylate cyclase